MVYVVEREIRSHVTEQRRAVRQERTNDILADLHAWMSATLQSASAKSNLAGAFKYALVHWEALTDIMAN